MYKGRATFLRVTQGDTRVTRCRVKNLELGGVLSGLPLTKVTQCIGERMEEMPSSLQILERIQGFTVG